MGYTFFFKLFMYKYTPFIASVALFRELIPNDDFFSISSSISSKVYWRGGKVTGAGGSSWDFSNFPKY